MNRSRLFVAIVAAIALSSCDDSATTPPATTVPDSLSKIQTAVFDRTCSCHELEEPSALLDLRPGHSYAALVNHSVENDAARRRFPYRVVPFQPDSSFLVAKLTGDLRKDEGSQMPEHGDVSREAIDAVRSWISKGALDN